MKVFTITIADEDGVVLDTTEVTAEELEEAAQDNLTGRLAAQGILAELSVGVVK